MNTRKKGMKGDVHPPSSLFFGNLFVHPFADQYKQRRMNPALFGSPATSSPGGEG
jgi:hypothetical protein